MFVSLGFVSYEISLFVYAISDQSASVQQQWSFVLLAIAGFVLVGIILWILYRFITYVKVDVLGIQARSSEIYCVNDSFEKDHQL